MVCEGPFGLQYHYSSQYKAFNDRQVTTGVWVVAPRMQTRVLSPPRRQLAT